MQALAGALAQRLCHLQKQRMEVRAGALLGGELGGASPGAGARVTHDHPRRFLLFGGAAIVVSHSPPGCPPAAGLAGCHEPIPPSTGGHHAPVSVCARRQRRPRLKPSYTT